jgi:hypothetical protein
MRKVVRLRPRDLLEGRGMTERNHPSPADVLWMPCGETLLVTAASACAQQWLPPH